MRDLLQNKLKLDKSSQKNALTYAIVVVAFVLMQIFSATGLISNTLKGQLVPICVYVVMAISLNLVVGISGELSLGHAGFMSVGAFCGVTVAIILKDAGMSNPLTLLIGIIVGAVFAAIVGFIIGIPVLHLRGDYLAIVTLAFGEIIKSVFNNLFVGADSNGLHISILEDTTNLAEGGRLIIGGPMGITKIPRIATFTAGFVLIIVTLFIVFNLIKSRTGRAIMAIRDNRIAAESIGLNVTKYKLIAFVISAALAGAAGVLFGLNFSTFSANKFDFNTSILILVFVVLGGLGNMLGSIIAATLLTVLPEVLREFSEYRMLVYAVVLIFIMLATNNPVLKGFFGKIEAKLKNAFTLLVQALKHKKGGDKNGKN